MMYMSKLANNMIPLKTTAECYPCALTDCK